MNLSLPLRPRLTWAGLILSGTTMVSCRTFEASAIAPGCPRTASGSSLRESEACQRHDLVDPITLFIATGLRISELLGLRWVDFEDATATLTVTGKVIRAAGQG